MFATFKDWANEGDDAKIGPALARLEKYCQPCRNIPFERYRFNWSLKRQEKHMISTVRL